MNDELDDDSLMQMIVNQDAKAFTILVHRHTPFFYKVAYQFLWNSSYANDILQEAFKSLWQRPNSFKKNKNTRFTTWFYTVVINLCKNNNRNEKSIQEKNIRQAKKSVADEYSTNERQFEFVKNILNQLAEKQQLALMLHYYQGLSQKEAAETMGMSLKAFESLAFRAKEKLKKLVKKQIKREEENGIETVQRFA
ncbi:MAG: hypothetical protein COA79_04440 [Planctomycetota bacterium]|nr:MAG: hypothetical protein COA79_04440 [Planctomycetota bacterium]